MPGPTDPVRYEDDFITSKVEVPRKCASCRFLARDSIRGFFCTQDREQWGDFPRGLDWGAWEPDQVLLQLFPPKVATEAMSRAVYSGDLLGFIREHRRVNPGLSIREAKRDYRHLRSVLEREE